ncbi:MULTISPECIES: AarF/ABC1/UbiB kinase family protein [Cyanophyceae]|uniref:ABC1 kinase family protein n=1 Tax=Cyanophyceae TaxID=3028117 RepID=UPI001682E38F|nr:MULTISPECIES: AarF/ABC1/UbiB kinase family protein [Cyanophyceae]MBD1918590.1 AarF/ABC1/UbiB kinase family protein [Phormidium sp. FACHB-77]MBD2031261.1 AarF/ABC1/UbiB kinase family protein [Phormidium sp. FACHB-322]MBD2052328.1 AarF/ABC1/UbiB kinase family protein [Leptolyngbya sp. FACHB-60]
MVSSSRLARQKEIIEVVLGNGWDYMRRLLVGGKADEPEIPPPAVLRNILTDLGPVYVKLGQLLSTRPDLMPPAYIEELSSLQTTVPPVDPKEIEAYIRQHLGKPPEALFERLDYQAIAAGSIAQTHKAVLKDGRQVAVKVQRPGIERQVERDVTLIRDVAKLVSATQFGQRYNVVDLAEEFADAINAELDFTTEAGYTDQLRRNLSKSTWYDANQLIVPQIYWDLTNTKIMTMEWLEGTPLLKADLLAEDAHSDVVGLRAAATTLLFRAFFKQYFVDGFFHADPHPGNIFYLEDGRLALLDCGMMGHMDPRTRNTITEMVLAIVNCDAQRCCQLTLQLAEPLKPVNLARLESDYTRLLGRYYGLSLEQINTAEIFGEILAAGIRNNLRWPANVGLFTKSLANLEGAVRQFNPGVNLLEEVRPLMADLFRQQMVGDDPLLALLRTGLEFRNLSLSSPRQLGFLLDRLSSEQLKFSLSIQGVDDLRRSLDESSNRHAFSTVVAALIIGAAIVSTGQQTSQGQILSIILFAAASFFGLWLLFSIVRPRRRR